MNPEETQAASKPKTSETPTAPAAGLVLVGTPIGNMGDLSQRAIQTLAEADIIACEDTRHTGKLLKRSAITPKKLMMVNEQSEESITPDLIARIKKGCTIALVSNAGMPSISDPGYRLVAAVIENDLPLTAVPGPTAAITALALSGLPTHRFIFEGFLPRRKSKRQTYIKALANEDRTAIIYESPRRLKETLTELNSVLGGGAKNRRVVIVKELTKLYESFWRGSLADAPEADIPDKGECVIVLAGKGDERQSDKPDTSEITEALKEELKKGGTRKDAAQTVADKLGLSRRMVYEVMNKIT